MNAEEFYEYRHSDWQTLEALLESTKLGVSSLSSGEIQTLGSLYRAVTSDLALANRDFPHHPVRPYLNNLVAQTHAVIYRSQPLSLRRFRRFAVRGFPLAFRQSLPFVAVAALLLLLPAAFAGWMTYRSPEAARWFLPLRTQDLIEVVEDERLWIDLPVQERPYASSFIMRNNIQVTMLAFGSGILVGLPTVWIMVMNGTMLGGVTGLTAHHGLGFELWTFVIGHGVLELTVVAIAGGSGLMLGWSILQPGFLSRRDSLALAGRKAIRLLVGCVPVLVVAGLIEGFISPSEAIPWPAKWALGLTTGALFLTYLLRSGRKDGD